MKRETRPCCCIFWMSMRLWETWAGAPTSRRPRVRLWFLLRLSRSGLDRFIHTREQPPWNVRRFFSAIPTIAIPARRCQGNPTEALLRAVGTLAVLRCGCSVASLRAGSVTLTDEILNILQGLQQCSITMYQRRPSVSIIWHQTLWAGLKKTKNSGSAGASPTFQPRCAVLTLFPDQFVAAASYSR